jgi:hypothetical protein
MPTPPHPRGSLLAQILAGSDQVFAAIADRLIAYCEERTRNLPKHVGDPVRAQVVFLVWKLTSTEEGRQKLRTLDRVEGYFSRVIRNAVAEEMPPRPMKPVTPSIPAKGVCPVARFENEELLGAVRDVMGGLSPLDQELLHLRFVLGHRGKDLAKRIAPNQPRSFVKAMTRALRRAEDNFRRRLARDFPGIAEEWWARTARPVTESARNRRGGERPPSR